VAEDNPFNLEVVRTFIEMAHMKCTWAPNGQRVLDIYKENVAAFDLILMDCQMPILDGYCATRAIREFEVAESLERIPIVGLTAFAMSGDREKCIDAGMDDYLTKPIGKAALIRTIAAHKRASAPVTAENVGRRLDESESMEDRRALGDDLETSMIDATLVTRDATMMAPGCFRPGSRPAAERKEKKESRAQLLTKDGDGTPIPEIVKPVVE
jgi:CheY-like chemotaxis protein